MDTLLIIFAVFFSFLIVSLYIQKRKGGHKVRVRRYSSDGSSSLSYTNERLESPGDSNSSDGGWFNGGGGDGGGSDGGGGGGD